MSIDLTVRTWVDPAYDDDRLAIFADLPHKHDAVMVASRGQVAPVDRSMAELVYLLWQLGIPTTASCEDVLPLMYGQEDAAELEKSSGPRAQLAFANLKALQVAMRVFRGIAHVRGAGKWRLEAWATNEDLDLIGQILLPQAHIEGVTLHVRSLITDLKENNDDLAEFPLPWIESEA